MYTSSYSTSERASGHNARMQQLFSKMDSQIDTWKQQFGAADGGHAVSRGASRPVGAPASEGRGAKPFLSYKSHPLAEGANYATPYYPGPQRAKASHDHRDSHADPANHSVTQSASSDSMRDDTFMASKDTTTERKREPLAGETTGHVLRDTVATHSAAMEDLQRKNVVLASELLSAREDAKVTSQNLSVLRAENNRLSVALESLQAACTVTQQDNAETRRRVESMERLFCSRTPSGASLSTQALFGPELAEDPSVQVNRHRGSAQPATEGSVSATVNKFNAMSAVVEQPTLPKPSVNVQMNRNTASIEVLNDRFAMLEARLGSIEGYAADDRAVRQRMIDEAVEMAVDIAVVNLRKDIETASAIAAKLALSEMRQLDGDGMQRMAKSATTTMLQQHVSRVAEEDVKHFNMAHAKAYQAWMNDTAPATNYHHSTNFGSPNNQRHADISPRRQQQQGTSPYTRSSPEQLQGNYEAYQTELLRLDRSHSRQSETDRVRRAEEDAAIERDLQRQRLQLEQELKARAEERRLIEERNDREQREQDERRARQAADIQERFEAARRRHEEAMVADRQRVATDSQMIIDAGRRAMVGTGALSSFTTTSPPPVAAAPSPVPTSYFHKEPIAEVPTTVSTNYYSSVQQAKSPTGPTRSFLDDTLGLLEEMADGGARSPSTTDDDEGQVAWPIRQDTTIAERASHGGSDSSSTTALQPESNSTATATPAPAHHPEQALQPTPLPTAEKERIVTAATDDEAEDTEIDDDDDQEVELPGAEVPQHQPSGSLMVPTSADNHKDSSTSSRSSLKSDRVGSERGSEPIKAAMAEAVPAQKDSKLATIVNTNLQSSSDEEQKQQPMRIESQRRKPQSSRSLGNLNFASEAEEGDTSPSPQRYHSMLAGDGGISRGSRYTGSKRLGGTLGIGSTLGLGSTVRSLGSTVNSAAAAMHKSNSNDNDESEEERPSRRASPQPKKNIMKKLGNFIDSDED